jgi:hypothetical protein
MWHCARAIGRGQAFAGMAILRPAASGTGRRAPASCASGSPSPRAGTARPCRRSCRHAATCFRRWPTKPRVFPYCDGRWQVPLMHRRPGLQPRLLMTPPMFMRPHAAFNVLCGVGGWFVCGFVCGLTQRPVILSDIASTQTEPPRQSRLSLQPAWQMPPTQNGRPARQPRLSLQARCAYASGSNENTLRLRASMTRAIHAMAFTPLCNSLPRRPLACTI